MSAPSTTEEHPNATSGLGERWLPYVRRGSIALILATLIPSSGAHVMLLNMPLLTSYALALQPPRVGEDHARYLFLFAAFSWTIVFAGWMGWWISRKPARLASPPSAAMLGWTRRLFLLTWLPPCFFMERYTQRLDGFTPLTALITIALYLGLGAWMSRATRRHAGTWRAVVGYMLLPTAASLFAWICIGIIFLLCPDVIFTHGILVGGFGALFLLIGVVGWWRDLVANEQCADSVALETSLPTPAAPPP